MKRFQLYLILLVSSLSITGVSFFDGGIWKVLFIVIGELTYLIVSVLFSNKFIRGSVQGGQAYSFIFIIFLLGAYGLYTALLRFHIWLSELPLWVKIAVPSVLFILILLIIFIKIFVKKETENETVSESTSIHSEKEVKEDGFNRT